MKKLFVLFALATICPLAPAQILISDFSNLSTQAFSPFGQSWNGGTPAADQFVQNSGNVSITSVNGGNPDGQGNFNASLPGSESVNLTGMLTLQLTARVDSGNANTALTIVLEDGSFTEIGTATFLASSFNSSFSTVNAPITLAGGGDITNATFWTLSGDNVVGDTVRMSFDNLDAILAVPEPSSFAMLGLGLGFLGFCFYRRQSHFGTV